MKTEITLITLAVAVGFVFWMRTETRLEPGGPWSAEEWAEYDESLPWYERPMTAEEIADLEKPPEGIESHVWLRDTQNISFLEQNISGDIRPRRWDSYAYTSQFYDHGWIAVSDDVDYLGDGWIRFVEHADFYDKDQYVALNEMYFLRASIDKEFTEISREEYMQRPPEHEAVTMNPEIWEQKPGREADAETIIESLNSLWESMKPPFQLYQRTLFKDNRYQWQVIYQEGRGDALIHDRVIGDNPHDMVDFRYHTLIEEKDWFGNVISSTFRIEPDPALNP